MDNYNNEIEGIIKMSINFGYEDILSLGIDMLKRIAIWLMKI